MLSGGITFVVTGMFDRRSAVAILAVTLIFVGSVLSFCTVSSSLILYRGWQRRRQEPRQSKGH